MTKKYTYFLGLNDKDTKKQRVNTYCTMSELMELIANMLGGGSISNVNGVFKHEDGTIVYETTIKIETLGYQDTNVYTEFGLLLKEKYNQESVLMEVSEVNEIFF